MERVRSLVCVFEVDSHRYFYLARGDELHIYIVVGKGAEEFRGNSAVGAHACTDYRHFCNIAGKLG